MVTFTFSARCHPDGAGIRVEITAEGNENAVGEFVLLDLKGQLNCDLATWTRLKRALRHESPNVGIAIEEQ